MPREGDAGMAKATPKQDLVIAGLRRQIIDRTYPPGSRVPSRKALESVFGASLVTVHRALDRLQKEGFLVPRGPRGTFVVDCPPHLCNFGLVFVEKGPGQGNWSQFHTAIRREAQRIQRQSRYRFIEYYGLGGPDGHDSFQRLRDDARSRRLAGILFVLVKPSYFDLTQVGDLPTVAVQEGNAVVRIDLDTTSLLEQMLRHVKSQGRRRVSFVLTGFPERHDIIEPWLTRLLPQHGLRPEKRWMHCLDARDPSWAGNLMSLLFDRGHPERPDAIVITDDNLVAATTRALVDLSVRVPEDVTVVAHANFPWPTPSAVPVKRFGFDIREVLRRSIEVIDAMNRGARVARKIVLPAVSDNGTGRVR
ncbi:MAG: Bacterial regulatory proteins, gntR family [Lentisphaerae bacterium ADurb.BinA184]|nr:MAG: Bacterial regulatory proteins, gntR family [Lentisphaerae bacterium ADurb.BinA184]